MIDFSCKRDTNLNPTERITHGRAFLPGGGKAKHLENTVLRRFFYLVAGDKEAAIDTGYGAAIFVNSCRP